MRDVSRPPKSDPVHPLVDKRQRWTSELSYEFCSEYGVDDPVDAPWEQAAEYERRVRAIYSHIEEECDAERSSSRITYYAKFSEGYSRENPSGIVRRRLTDQIELHEAFTRNLKWEPTEYLRLSYLGHNDADHAEITRAEADAFIERAFRNRNRNWQQDS